MRKILLISILALFGCEEIVEVSLPNPESLLVVEGFITDSLQNQEISLSRSIAFSNGGSQNTVSNAQIQVVAQSGENYAFSHVGDGLYESDLPFQGIAGISYKLVIEVGDRTIESSWDEMPQRVESFLLEVSSFEENDPGSDNQITVFYPKVTATDTENIENQYRWLLFKNDLIFKEPEAITIQDDRFFDGNLIPNNFQAFNYEAGDKMEVQLLAISSQTYAFLNLLQSQITTLGRSSGTTPAVVRGNLRYTDNGDEFVLGYFGSVAIQSGSLIVP